MWSRMVYGKKDLPYNYSEFICDEESDIANLPTSIHHEYTECEHCSVGSKALVVGTGNLYILNNKNEWKLMKNKTSTSVSDEINDVFNSDTFILDGNTNGE